MKHLYKLSQQLLVETDCPAKIKIVKNTWNLCKELSKDFLQYDKKYTPRYLYQNFLKTLQSTEYLNQRCPLYFTYKKKHKRATAHGCCDKYHNTIYLNRELRVQNKKYIKYVILHEIGHYLTGLDKFCGNEKQADEFAMKFIGE